MKFKKIKLGANNIHNSRSKLADLYMEATLIYNVVNKITIQFSLFLIQSFFGLNFVRFKNIFRKNLPILFISYLQNYQKKDSYSLKDLWG